MAWSLPEGCVLGIFGKKPEPGRSKTRLASEFGEEIAAEIAGSMLFDILDFWSSETILAPGGRRVFVFDPPDSGPWFDSFVPAAFALLPQREGNLGERMRAFFEAEFADGAARVVLIGSDAPLIDPSVLVSAFLCLETRDVVIGPSTDGGYYLIGARDGGPPIFDGIQWSGSTVLAQTIDRLNDIGLSLSVLPASYDVDTPDDWRTLAGHLRALRRAGLNPMLPRIEALAEQTLTRTRRD